MVDYRYADLFWQDNVDKQWKIEYAGGTIRNEELFSQSIEITESLCSEKELRFGSCEASSLKFKVANIMQPLIDEWLTASVVLGNHDDVSLMIGMYKVTSDKPTADRQHRDIIAYDAMYDIISADVTEWYNDVLPEKGSSLTMKRFRESFIRHFGLTEVVPDAGLVNDWMTVERTIDPEQISGRDVITAICEINGCFGHIGRDGKFHFIVLRRKSDAAYTKIGTYISCKYEDYLTRTISKVQIRQEENEENDIGAIYPDTESNPEDNYYIIKGNFLAYGKGAGELSEIARRLFGVVSGVAYRPFEADCAGNPCLEVGDAIRIPTRYDTVESYILQRTLKGIQSLRDAYRADGAEKYSENVNSIHTSIIQLKGKTNTLIRTVDETISKIEDLEEGTETKFHQTAEQIALEAKRAIDAETELAGAITVAVGEIDLRVSYGDIISAINLSPEQIKIDTDKLNVEALEIDLTGYVTISSLADPDSTTIINGNLIRTGVIMSENFLDADGKETGEGTLLNLINGYMVFRGDYLYAWLDRPVEEHEAEIEMQTGRMRIRDKTRGEALYYSHEGISTTEDANKATGVIDFRSGIYGETLSGSQYQGVTVQTKGSPAALRSLSNQVIIQPNVLQAVNNPGDSPEDYTSDMFTFGMARRYHVDDNGGIVYSEKVSNGDGLMWYGSRRPRDEGGWDQYTCLEFSADGENPYTATLSGDRKKLAPHYASNMYKPVREIRLKKDADGRIVNMRFTMDAFISDEVVNVPVTYNDDGSISAIGDTVIR